MARGDSTKGKANLWREGKDGAGKVKRRTSPGGGDGFAETSKFEHQFDGEPKMGGGGAHAPSSLDNHSVFANSTAGLAVADKPFLPDPGSGRDGLDMYSARDDERDFGLHMSKEPENREKPERGVITSHDK
jgi:hypothetical protein